MVTMLPQRVKILCYFIQAHHLAEYGEPLFSEAILAGPNGPIVDVPEPAQVSMINHWTAGDAGALSNAQQRLVGRLALEFDPLLATELRAKAKAHLPWQNANEKRTEADPFPAIHHNDMTRYYRALLDAPRTPEEYAARCMWTDRYREPAGPTTYPTPS